MRQTHCGASVQTSCDEPLRGAGGLILEQLWLQCLTILVRGPTPFPLCAEAREFHGHKACVRGPLARADRCVSVFGQDLPQRSNNSFRIAERRGSRKYIATDSTHWELKHIGSDMHGCARWKLAWLTSSRALVFKCSHHGRV